MDFLEILKSAADALKSNKLRTSLTMLGIVIGITSVILIYSIGQGAVAFITKELTSFGIDYFQINPGSSQVSTFAGSGALTMDDFEAIRTDKALTNVRSVVPLSIASVSMEAEGTTDEVVVYGSTAEAVEILRPDVYGEFLTTEYTDTSADVVVLGVDVVETFYGENADPVGESILIDNRTYEVIGVMESSSVLAGSFINNSAIIPISVLMNEITGEETLQEIDVMVRNTDQMNQTIDDVEALLRERHELDEDDENDFQITSAQDMLSTAQTITGLLTVMVVAISGISLVVGGVGVMNIMLVSVTERTKEIGLLKAIGAKEKDILTQFLVEASVMTLAGGVIGISLGLFFAYLISLGFGIPFIVSIPAIVISAGVSSLVGVVFGLYPARRAARLSPIDALQYQ
jgi:putative ABC transport system permease protein